MKNHQVASNDDPNEENKQGVLANGQEFEQALDNKEAEDIAKVGGAVAAIGADGTDPQLLEPSGNKDDLNDSGKGKKAAKKGKKSNYYLFNYFYSWMPHLLRHISIAFDQLIFKF